MGITGDRLRRIRTAAVIHDIGKIDTPIDVLCKPAALTADEFELIKRHPIDGERLVRILETRRSRRSFAVTTSDSTGLATPTRSTASRSRSAPGSSLSSTRSTRSPPPDPIGQPHHKQALDIIQADAGVKLDAEAVEAFRRGYLARRPIAAWIAISELADRTLLWCFGDALGSGVRLVESAPARWR